MSKQDVIWLEGERELYINLQRRMDTNTTAARKALRSVGLQIVNDAIANVIYHDALDEAAKQVEKGVSLNQAISVYDIFPPILSQMVAVGEQTGKLDEVLKKISVYFQAETEQAVKNMTTAIEPMLMIFLGIGVGIIMIAIIMPIYNLTSQF